MSRCITHNRKILIRKLAYEQVTLRQAQGDKNCSVMLFTGLLRESLSKHNT